MRTGNSGAYFCTYKDKEGCLEFLDFTILHDDAQRGFKLRHFPNDAAKNQGNRQISFLQEKEQEGCSQQ